ncbi:MAG: hypothetical protein IJX76_00900 [Clostridia bacterium]|nr:hypothetical protein [Clostridia bacterium]
MKKIFFLILGLTLFLSTAACQSDDTVATTSTAPVTSAKSGEAETEEDAKLLTLTIGGTDLSEYTIVYADSVYDQKILSYFNTEHDFFKLIADDIAEKIRQRTGVTLSVVKDTAAAKTNREILVGPTNRSESDSIDTLDVYKTYVKRVGNKVVVGAGYISTPYTGGLRESYCFASTYHAWDKVDAYMQELTASGTETWDWSAEDDFSTTVDLITVACIGDSITEGAGSTARDFLAYPAVLGRILWQDHLIINVGNSGKTMRDDLALCYRGTTQHAAVRRYAPLYDYALIMLGTNDSYFDRNWTATDDERYLTSAENLVADLTKNNDALQIMIMNCPIYYGTNGSGSQQVRTLQGLLPGRLTDAGYSTTFFDMYTFTAEHLGRENFPDELHPGDTGYQIMAAKLAEVLAALEDGTYSPSES